MKNSGITMTSKSNIARAVTIFSAAYALKYFYSISSVNELRWILAPTTFLVETISGIHFRFESSAGYLSEDRTFLIALPCSGVNFLIIAFLMLTLGAIWRTWPEPIRWRTIPIAAVVAYLVTLIANATRIVIALWLQRVDLGYDYEDVHRVEGIVVYFGFLLLLFFAAERFAREDVRFDHKPAIRRIAIPLMIYYGFTLGVPLVGGAFHDGEFWKHALVVFVASSAVMLPFVMFYVARPRSDSNCHFER